MRIRDDAPTGFQDPRVGDSNSRGKIEQTIREVKGLIRTFRASFQEKLNASVSLDLPIVHRIIPHVSYIITRCKVHECGRTSLTRMHGHKTFRPLLIQIIKRTPAEPTPGPGSDVTPTFSAHRKEQKPVSYQMPPEVATTVGPA